MKWEIPVKVVKMKRAGLIVLICLVITGAGISGCNCQTRQAAEGTPTPTPTPVLPTTHEQTLIPLPFAPYDFLPEREAKGVPVSTVIAVCFTRPPQIVEMVMEPEVEIREVTKEIVSLASGRFTFYPMEPLQPETTYTVTITYGVEEAPEGSRPTSTRSWQFTTGPEYTYHIRPPSPEELDRLTTPDLFPQMNALNPESPYYRKYPLPVFRK